MYDAANEKKDGKTATLDIQGSKANNSSKSDDDSDDSDKKTDDKDDN